MYLDPEFLRDPSGCTAVAALITEDDRIIVVSLAPDNRTVTIPDQLFPISLSSFAGSTTGKRRRFEMCPWYQGRIETTKF